MDKLLSSFEQLKAQITALQKKSSNNDVILKARLKKMDIYYGRFMEIFDIPNTYLSGGLIAQILLGENWPTDIDIWTDDAEAVLRVLDGCRMHKHFTEMHETDYGDDDALKYPNSIKVWQGQMSKNVTIEIIECKDPLDTISKFDLEFCKCYFDGRDFHVMDEHALINKKHDGVNVIRWERYDKYLNRGFNITGIRSDPQKSKTFTLSLFNDDSIEDIESDELELDDSVELPTPPAFPTPARKNTTHTPPYHKGYSYAGHGRFNTRGSA